MSFLFVLQEMALEDHAELLPPASTSPLGAPESGLAVTELAQSLNHMDAMRESLLETANVHLAAGSMQPHTPIEDPVAQTGEATVATEGNTTVNEESAITSEEIATATAELQAATSRVQLRLKMLDERVFTVTAELATTIADFRVQVADVTQVPVDRQRLIYRGT